MYLTRKTSWKLLTAANWTTAAATRRFCAIGGENTLGRQESGNLNVTQCGEGIQTALLTPNCGKPLPTWHMLDNLQRLNL